MNNTNISKKSNTSLPVSTNTSASNTSTSVKNTIAAKNNTKTNTNNTKKNNATTTNGTQSNNKTAPASFTGTNVFGIIILVVVILLLIIAVYWVYTVYSTKSFQSFLSAELMPDITNATVSTNIPSSTIPSSNYSNEYAISFWMNIDDYNYNYGTEKTIINRGADGNPIIVLGAKQNDLIVRVQLQGPSKNKSSFSGFEDIPIRLPSLNTGNGFIQPAEVNTNSNNKTISSNSIEHDINDSNIPESFKKIGSNNIDYPTIQYTFDNNNSNSECGYFDLISGNDVNKSNKVSSNGNKLVEGFAASDDAITAGVRVMVDICNIMNTMKSQTFADNSINNINSSFESMISSLDKTRATADSGDAISKAVIDSLSSYTSNASPQSSFTESTILEQQLATLQTDTENLMQYANAQVDYTAFANVLNTQMSSINCTLTMTGTSDIDKAVSFYENIINLIKKSIFTYISNMNSSIAKIYPELAGTQGGSSCISDLYSNNDPSVGTCVVKMVPLQKWVNVIVSVYNQIIDIYIDGQLASSCVLKGFPNISTEDINITPDGGFSGKMSRVVFMNTAVTVQQAKDIYYSGPVATYSLFSMIPTWVYWIILIIIIIAIAYSFFM